MQHRRDELTPITFHLYVPTMKTLNFNLLRCTLRVAILLLSFASLAHSAFAQPPGIEEPRKHLGETFRDARINKAVVCDFIDDEGRLTLQGVLLADRLSFALIEEQGFETLNRDRVNMRLYGPKLPKNDDEPYVMFFFGTRA
jgi:hypothetical protein